MAYINVAEWTPDQVTDWLKGLDDSMYNYVHSFTNNEVSGRQLLNIRPYELDHLGIKCIGHQEIVLEAVEHLRNFHFNLDKDNLQFMALHVATAARSLHRQLSQDCDASKIETKILHDITRTIGTIKPLVSWLDRVPFKGQFQFAEICRNMLRVGLEMATIAQRDRFVERPVEQIRFTAEKLERLANYIIQDITDPMLLQPASLNLVTLKKRESELGFNIESSYHRIGIHRVIDIKFNSPAHNSGKIEDGDEIVQINYQTVVGWQYKTVLMQLSESLPDVLLTLKKRPKHTKIYGQIYMQPYRLPSKKRAMGSRWGENLPSPRAGFLTVPESTFLLPLPLKGEEKSMGAASSDTDSSCSDMTPTDTKAAEKEIRLFYPKPRTMLQRRHTMCFSEMEALKSGRGSGGGGNPIWHERKAGADLRDPSSPSLRDKSISFGFGLEIAPRPTTCIGLSNAATPNGGKFAANSDMKSLFGPESKRQRAAAAAEVATTAPSTIVEEAAAPSPPRSASKPGVSKVVRFDANMKYEDYTVDDKYTCNVDNTILETFEPILYADEEEEDILERMHHGSSTEDTACTRKEIIDTLERMSKSQSVPLAEAVNVPVVAARRGRLDKSHSTPAYDNSGEEGDTASDTPPAIEPRKEFLLQTPPAPPPRPRKQKDLGPPVVPPPPPKPSKLNLKPQAPLPPDSTPGKSEPPPAMPMPPPTIEVITAQLEASELLTPTKTRTLTLKKKHSLLNKRRNVNLKVLGTGDIQGHLYRRTKDRRGVTFWARLYFVMLDTILYGFRSKESPKASCMILLPGYTVCHAKEVHSKPYAFKVYHAAKTFYFAAESQDALSQWVEFLNQGALQMQLTAGGGGGDPAINARDLFSETDSSGEETDSQVSKNLCTPSPQASKDVAALLASSTKGGGGGSASGTPTSSLGKHERPSVMGSLRKLTKGSLFQSSSSHSHDKKPSSDIPVPTEQYRSYRKVPGGSCGIQIGTNTPGYHDPSSTSLLLSSHSANMLALEAMATPSLGTTPPLHGLSQTDSRRNSMIGPSGGGDSFLGPPSSPAPSPHSVVPHSSVPHPAVPHPAMPPPLPQPTVTLNEPSTSNTPTSDCSNDSPSKASKKNIPYDIMHASNPNLVEFEYHSSKMKSQMPKINPANTWDVHHHNIQGFVTLKDLMLQKQEEEAQEMYNNRVLLGVEKKDERKRQAAAAAAAAAASHQANAMESSSIASSSGVSGSGGGAGGKPLSKTQSRSLPKTPDYEISFKPDDENIKRTRTKEGLKLRDFGYELISGDEPLGGAASATRHTDNQLSYLQQQHHQQQQQLQHNDWSAAMRARHLLKSSQQLAGRHKKHSTASTSSTTSSMADSMDGARGGGGGGDKRSGSFKKKCGKSSERLFHFGKHSGVTMTLPLNKKSGTPSLTDSFNGDGGGGGGHGMGGGIKKSLTYNNDLKDKVAATKYDAHRKNSAPMPTFANNNNNNNNAGKSGKEKRLLGSPLFHRTIFGSHQYNQAHQQHPAHVMSPVTPTFTGREYDREIFSQVVFPKVPSNKYRKHSGSSVSSSGNVAITAPDVIAPPPPSLPPLIVAEKEVTTKGAGGGTSSNVATPDYPNMECPPVFEPEIYSLTDPCSSLRRKNSNESQQDEK